MHLVFFNRSFYPDITATGQLLTELCEDLVKNYNCHTTAIVGRPLFSINNYPAEELNKKIIKKEYYQGIEIIRVKNTTFSTQSFLRRISNYLTYFFLSFIASFKLKRIDLVITLTDPPIIGLIGLFTARRFNVPLIISVRDIFPEAAKGLGNYQSKIMDFFLDWINRFCLKKSDHIVVLGKLMRRRLIEEKGIRDDKVSIISDWADCAKIFPVSKINSFSISHNIFDFFVIMYSGNLGASAGLETLIESARFLKDYKDILFVFIGEGFIKDKLIKLTNEYNLQNIRFLPYQPKDRLVYSFSSADIFVIPLKKGLAGYSVPSKIYSILASGRPYIAYMQEESEVAQITKRFECGILARPQDALDLTKKILFFYKNKEQRIKMGETARKVAEFFDQKIGVKAYYDLFVKIKNDKKDI